ncbi:retrotransposon protein, putative, ty1-copia subclass [Tanacetum coccineum]
MLGSMTPELHRQFKNYSPYELLQELKSMFKKQAGVERFDLIQTFHTCKQEEGKPVGLYVLKMKGYVEQLERLGYVLPQDLSVGLILNGLTSDFARFVRNYNMHNMGKTIGELHALFIKYEKFLPKKAATPQVMAIQGGRIQKANKKSLNAKGKGKGKGKGYDKPVYIAKPKNPKPSAKEHPAKDDACHHCKEVGHWKRNCPVYLAELIMKKKQVSTASSSGKMTRKPFSHRTERVTDLLGLIHTDVCGPLKHASRQVASYFITFTDDYSHYDYLTPPYTPQQNRVSKRKNRTLLDMVRSIMNLITLQLSFWDYALESATRILNMVPTKKVDKTPYELWYEKVPKLSYLKVWRCEALVKQDTPDKLQQRYVKCILVEYPKETMEVSGRAVELEEIQDEDTSPSEITSEIPVEVEGFEPPQEELILVHRSVWTYRAPERLCLNVEEEEHSLGGLNEPTSYKAVMLDLESNKWLDAMNTEMQSMIDNKV